MTRFEKNAVFTVLAIQCLESAMASYEAGEGFFLFVLPPLIFVAIFVWLTVVNLS